MVASTTSGGRRLPPVSYFWMAEFSIPPGTVSGMPVMIPSEELLRKNAEELAQALKGFPAPCRLVLAESCTGGLVSMTLTEIPGISEFFCGSAVTYRNETKACWLGVSRAQLADPMIGPVSRETADQMCRGVLQQTPEATLAAAVTGHLGPDAPPKLDGVIYIGVAFRDDLQVRVERHLLSAQPRPGIPLRHDRRTQAAQLVLQSLLHRLKESSGA